MPSQIAIKVGCDPEVFVKNAKGQIIPCVGIFPGTKEKPFPIVTSAVGLNVQEDGVTLEFGMSPRGRQDFRAYVVHALGELTNYVQAVLPGHRIALKACNEFDAAALMSKQAMTFGCSPDVDAYRRGAFRSPPTPQELANFRCAGGHIHIGYDKERSKVPEWALIQFLDLAYLSYISKDKQGIRRKFYGQAGLYRVKEYGIEYRTPSNFWLDGNNIHFTDSVSNLAHQVLNAPMAAQALWRKIDWDIVQASIAAEENKLGEHKLNELIEETYGWRYEDVDAIEMEA